MRSQIEQMYPDDPAFVSKLLRQKTTLGMYKVNPEAPDRADYTLYYVRLDTTVSREHLTAFELSLMGEAELDDETAPDAAGLSPSPALCPPSPPRLPRSWCRSLPPNPSASSECK